jgi:hypothetical protein
MVQAIRKHKHLIINLLKIYFFIKQTGIRRNTNAALKIVFRFKHFE